MAKFRIDASGYRTTFSETDDIFLIENYLRIPVKPLGKKINKSFTGVSTRLKQLGLVIPSEIREERKNKGLFRKGQIPPNKGVKMSNEVREKVKHTWFPKGNNPGNAVPDWEERIRKDKLGRSYIMIKIPGQRKLCHKQVWVWEKTTGKKLQKGQNIIFKDGNSLNVEFINLECLTDKELMLKNTIHQYPDELKIAIRRLSKIKKHLRNESNKHQ